MYPRCWRSSSAVGELPKIELLGNSGDNNGCYISAEIVVAIDPKYSLVIIESANRNTRPPLAAAKHSFS